LKSWPVSALSSAIRVKTKGLWLQWTTWDRCYDFGNIFGKRVAKTLAIYCSDKGYEDFKGLFQSVEYIHRRTQMITAGVAAAVTFYRIESGAL
jgi:hypothetical protein